MTEESTKSYSEQQNYNSTFGNSFASNNSTVNNITYVHSLTQAGPSQRPTVVEEPNAAEFKIPFSRRDFGPVPNFVGREHFLAKLEAFFDPENAAKHNQKVLVLHGMGGIGKTQIAVQYARLHQHHYNTLLLLDGSSVDAVKASIAKYVNRIPGRDQQSFNHLNSTEQIDSHVKEVLGWLSIPENNNWLLIFDNVDRNFEANNLQDPQAFDIGEYFPSLDHGSILVTSRLNNLQQLGETIAVSPMENIEAIGILQIFSKKALHDDPDVEATVKLLDGLPLALTLAGSYIMQADITFKTYYERYQTVWAELIKQQDKTKLRQYGKTMGTTWLLSYEQMKRECAAAATLLDLWSFCSNSRLQHALVLSSNDAKASLSQDLAQDLAFLQEPMKFSEAIQSLTRYSLINPEDTEDSFSIHPVLHDWCFYTMMRNDAEKTVQLYHTLANLMFDFLVDHGVTAAFQLPLHGIQMVERVRQLKQHYHVDRIYDWPFPVSSLKIGALLNSTGWPVHAEEILLLALKGFEHIFGLEDVVIFSVFKELGISYLRQGKLDKAHDLLRRSFLCCQMYHGPTHKVTLLVGAKLLRVSQALGKPKGSIKQDFLMLEQALGELRHNLECSLDEANFSELLADFYDSQGESIKAEAVLERAVFIREKLLGLTDPLTLDSILRLSEWYRDQNKLTFAESTCLRAVETLNTQFRPDRKLARAPKQVLASIYNKQARYAEAEALCKDLLRAYETPEFMHDFSNRVTACIVLSGALICQEKWQEGEEIMRGHLLACEDKLDPNDVEVSSMRALLSIFLVKTGEECEVEDSGPLARAGGVAHADIIEAIEGLGA